MPRTNARGWGRGQFFEAKSEDKISASRPACPRRLNITDGERCLCLCISVVVSTTSMTYSAMETGLITRSQVDAGQSECAARQLVFWHRWRHRPSFCRHKLTSGVEPASQATCLTSCQRSLVHWLSSLLSNEQLQQNGWWLGMSSLDWEYFTAKTKKIFCGKEKPKNRLQTNNWIRLLKCQDRFWVQLSK